MKVHVAFIPDEAASAPTGIVVDVVRATSTIAQALAAGYGRVLCVPEIEQARALRDELPDSVVGGERDAVRIEGFDVGVASSVDQSFHVLSLWLVALLMGAA